MSEGVTLERFARRHAVALLASLLVAVGFGWLLHAGALPIVPPRAAFASVSWASVGIYALIWTLTLFLRSGRWYWLLAPIHRVPMRKVLTVSFIGYGALVMLPFRLGEFVRPALIRERGELPLLAATGTVGAERILDGLMLSVILLLALPGAGMLVPLPDHIGELPIPARLVPSAAYTALVVFFAAFLAMGVFYLRRQWARRVTERVVGLVSLRLARWAASAVEHVASGFGFLPRARFSVPYVAITALYWLCNVAGTELLLRGVGFPEASFLQACVVTGVLGIGTLLPNAPGFFGAFQVSLYAALALFFAPARIISEGAAFVFLFYVIQMGTALLGAAIAAVMERVSTREVLELE